MAYTVPRVLIEQQFVAAPIFANNPLAAFIFGPNYRPLRYTVAAEKSYTYIGDYGNSGLALTAYPWVTANPAARVDISSSYANITPYLENAFAEYFRGKGITNLGAMGSDQTFVVNGTWNDTDDYAAAVLITGSNYYTNKIRATTLSFAPGVNPTTGAVYTRSTYFSARDVQVGDWVAVTGLNGSATGHHCVCPDHRSRNGRQWQGQHLDHGSTYLRHRYWHNGDPDRPNSWRWANTSPSLYTFVSPRCRCRSASC
jgi:hypothetical protein